MDLTTKEAAVRLGVKQVTVGAWGDKGLFKGARKETSSRGDYWLIPEENIKNFAMPEKARKKSENPSDAVLAKRAQREREKAETVARDKN